MTHTTAHETPNPSPEGRAAIVAALVTRGVVVMDPEHTYVDSNVQISEGVVLYPGVHLRGNTSIGPRSQIGPDCWIEDSNVEADCAVRYSFVEGAVIRERSTVGPYTHLRPGADVGPDARIGNFVEVKNARLGPGVKAGHLSYLGDADIGSGANIGAGTITCNYDGKKKTRTTIESGAFIGSNSALVAPVTIGEDAYIAAGSTITEDVPARGRAFGRARQVNKPSETDPEEDGG